MVSIDQLASRAGSLYGVVMAAARRARTVNDWRLQRSRVLMEEVRGPKPTTQALQEIASGEVKVVPPDMD